MNPFTPIRGGAAQRATASDTEAVTSVHLLKGGEDVDSIEGQTGRSLGSTPERTSDLIWEHLSLRLGMDVTCSGRLQMQRLSPIQGISQREMDHCWPELEPTLHVRPEEEDVGSLDHVEHLTGRTERLMGVQEAGR